MRKIRHSTAFRKDYRRVKAGPVGDRLDGLLSGILHSLVADVPLPPERGDHRLVGPWSGYRECHLRPDLLLICAKPDPATLDLVRLGSHTELFD
jgi:mRNA interferase YafQ